MGGPLNFVSVVVANDEHTSVVQCEATDSTGTFLGNFGGRECHLIPGVEHLPVPVPRRLICGVGGAGSARVSGVTLCTLCSIECLKTSFGCS